jgi:hypothetical protein
MRRNNSLSLLISETLRLSASVANPRRLGHPNGLIHRHLGLKVASQETHPIALEKKMTTRY